MSRSMAAGMTDYSHQTFKEMLFDIQEWISNLSEVINLIDNHLESLTAEGYWNTISFDIGSIILYMIKFFKTSKQEMIEIEKELQTEVESHHMNRLLRIYQTADEVDKRIGRIWNNQNPGDYGNPNFRLLELIYSHGRDMAVDLIDLSNLAGRLEDFIGKKGTQTLQDNARFSDELSYIDAKRIKELEAINSPNFDLTKLLKICVELNECYRNNSTLAVSMLVRSLLDHIPPIFGFNNFIEVANNYDGGKSLKKSLQNLQNSSRNIADAHLHVPIRNKETIPNKTQVNFTNDLDVLLSEIVRILK